MKSIKLTAILGLLLAVSQPLHAIITFTQLTDDTFIVSHRVKFIGSRGQAMKLVYTKAASLCQAAGYTYMNVVGEDSQATQQYDNANASLRVQFFTQDGEGRIDCARNSSADYVAEAREKLANRGYRPPTVESAESDASGLAADAPDSSSVETANGDQDGSCTVDQIVAMAKSGLTAEQIRAACPAVACP